MEMNGVSPGLARWADQLKDMTVSPLTRDYPESTPDEATKGRRPIEGVEILAASPAVSTAINSLHELGSLHDLLVTAFVVLISRLTGDEDIVIGVNAETDGLPFVLRVQLTPGESFSQVLSKIKQVSTDIGSCCLSDTEPLIRL